MISVLLVLCNNVLNGSERYALDLAANLPESQFDVTIATPMKGPLSEIIIQRNLKEFVYDNKKLEYYTLKGLLNIYRYIKKNNFDVVHANAKFHPCLIGKLAGVKFTVETKHGIFYSSAQLKSLSKWRVMYENVKQNFVDKFIAISENDKNTMIKYFKIKAGKIHVIYNGLDFSQLDRYTNMNDLSKKKTLESEILIGNIGRMTFQKAQEILLEAFGMLNRKFQNVRLVLMGSGENEKQLRDFVESHGLQNTVIFKGYVKDIYNEMKNLNMLVLTSRFEGTPYVIFEAMALGVPVVTSDVGGINNIMTNEYDGMITAVDTPSSTMEAIEKLVSNDNLRETIIKNAFNTVQKYNVIKMAGDTANLYMKNLNKV
jgi:glycosyltransferase involved in cell wall biosynthesis